MLLLHRPHQCSTYSRCPKVLAENTFCNLRSMLSNMVVTIPNKKKCKKAKWLSEEVLQIADERREVKGKGERER